MRIRPVNKFIKLLSQPLFGDLSGISLSPFGIYTDHPDNPYIVNHERIHWRQQMEMLILPFYICYLTEFLIRRIRKNRAMAYVSISFEREAFDHHHDLNYLKNRKPYSWLKYLKD